MPIKKGKTYELKVTDLAFGGKGIAKIDGFAVFVDQAAPGDVVNARVIKRKKRFAEARIENMISPSPLRIEAPCPYSGACGGCKWQFLPYDIQLEYKTRHVEEALEHIGGLEGVIVNPAAASPDVFGYRNKMEFSCSDRKWLLPEQMGSEKTDISFALGLHVPGTFYKVLDIEACLLQPDLGNDILDDVRSHMKNSFAPVYGLRSHEGFWRFLMLRHSAARDEWMVNVVTSKEDRESVAPLAEFLMKKYPRIASVVNNITARKAGIAVGEYEIHLAGERVLREKIGHCQFEVSANSFFQTNTGAAKILYDTVKSFAGLAGTETVLDLYSGTGSIPVYLSDQASRIVGIEIVESAVRDAGKNRELNGADNCEFVLGDIRNTLSKVEMRPDVMIIDPPRDGMHKDVVKQVLAMAPEKIVYVSCNPSTLARDLALMKDDYRVLKVQPVDMFPHTFHIESVSKLQKI